VASPAIGGLTTFIVGKHFDKSAARDFDGDMSSRHPPSRQQLQTVSLKEICFDIHQK